MKPNIIFILLDACRADRFQGDLKKSKTPTIDSLIQKGTYFEQTFSSTDYTLGALTSIFTSRYPLGAGETKEHYYKIHSKSTNFIRHLKNEGYHAYATMHTSLSAMGFSVDFENEDKEYPSKFPIYGPLGKKVIEKLNSNIMVEPWIYFVHVLDLHAPVRVPEEFLDETYSERYDRMISLIDSWLANVIKLLDLNKTLLVITSDHGDYIPVIDTNVKESDPVIKKSKAIIKKFIPKSMHSRVHEKKFNLIRQTKAAKLESSVEKRSLNLRPDRERYFFDEVIHVPLLFVGYGIPEQKKINHMVRNIDIFPTIEDIINSNKKTDIDGRSLFPLMQEKNLDEVPIYMESTTIKTVQKSPQAVTGIRTSKYKYFRRLKEPSKNSHLYDLEKDPLEEKNIIKDNPDIVKKMESMISNIRENSLPRENQEEMDDEESKRVEEELKKLGYL